MTESESNSKHTAKPEDKIQLTLTISFDVDHKHKNRIVPIMEEIVSIHNNHRVRFIPVAVE